TDVAPRRATRSWRARQRTMRGLTSGAVVDPPGRKEDQARCRLSPSLLNYVSVSRMSPRSEAECCLPEAKPSRPVWVARLVERPAVIWSGSGQTSRLPGFHQDKSHPRKGLLYGWYFLPHQKAPRTNQTAACDAKSDAVSSEKWSNG